MRKGTICKIFELLGQLTLVSRPTIEEFIADKLEAEVERILIKKNSNRDLELSELLKWLLAIRGNGEKYL